MTNLTRQRYPTSDLPYQVKLADLDGDSLPDVVATLKNAGQFRMDTTNALPPNSEPHIRNDMYGLSIADLNGDLLPDIAVSNSRAYVLFQTPGMPGRFDQPELVLGVEP